MDTRRSFILIMVAAVWFMPAHAQEIRSLDPVVVTATRIGQPGFDLPLSIDSVGSEAIRNANPMVNLSESLARVPGIVAQNRQNYAQDLQISSRGFGARSTFGVRGVRLYVDGIPATMPDGQGQTSNIDLTSAARIEVLRGPFSALYGNSSGGVISVFTEDGTPDKQLSPFAVFGSYGTSHVGIKASGQQGPANFVASASRFETDSYRQHSAASRNTVNAKLRLIPGMGADADTAYTIVANSVSMPDVQDPLGLSRRQWQANPRGADPGALAFNTRKSVSQDQVGLNVEKFLNREDSLQAMVYAGHRATLQFQAIPVAAQLPLTSAGGVIDLSRHYGGTDLRWTRKTATRLGAWQWTAGVAADLLDEDRRGYENFIGATLGVQGRLRRDETNRVHNFDQYAQLQWEPGERWLLLVGIRNSHVHVRSDDHFIAPGNGNDSGSVRYRAFTPVLGTTFRVSKATSLYVSSGRGFETPTLNELSYRPGTGTGVGAAAGFNFGLRPSRSNNYEAGVKAFLGPRLRVNFAAFHIDTEDELTVLSNTAGRAVFQNAGRTRRDGIELSAQGSWPNGIDLVLSGTLLRAIYADPSCPAACTAASLVRAGNRIPGVPSASAYGELSWRHPASGFAGAFEGRYVSRIQVDDVNSDAAPAYFTANLRVGFEQKTGPWQVREFLRIDNLADRNYAGSVIVNESNQRFFEPAPGRNYVAGVTANYAW